MNIRIVGAGFYGCHIALELMRDGHKVTVFESKDDIFKGASGSIPARVHQGFHYPRSKKTRDACQAHAKEFSEFYSDFIRTISSNIYAVAENKSLVDFDQYVSTLKHEVEFEELREPEEYGLRHVEGAILTQENHIVTDKVRDFYKHVLGSQIQFGVVPEKIDDPSYDVTIDATFCAYDNKSIDRYEPCVVGLLEGPTDIAVTIMDGPFGSVYPWNPDEGLVSLSSALFTPFAKTCRTYEEAKAILDDLSEDDRRRRVKEMMDDLSYYYPALQNYKFKDALTSIRAMPLSGADTRLVDVIRVGKTGIRIRAGKIDAVVQATRIIKGMIC